MKTQIALALAFPLVWSGMWYFLTRKHVIASRWRRALLVAAWVAFGGLLRAGNIDLHIPGFWELFLFPILPFLQISRFEHAAYMQGVPAEQMVGYETLGMVVGFAILAECILVQRFVWTGYQLEIAQTQEREPKCEGLEGAFDIPQKGVASLHWAKLLVIGVSLTALLWQFLLWLTRNQARVDAVG